jgi:CRP/FNR family transcriptional regulator
MQLPAFACVDGVIATRDSPPERAQVMRSKPHSVVEFNLGHRCSTCSQGEFCIRLGLNPDEALQVDQIMNMSRPMRPGQYLFRAGEPLKAIYAVRSGCFKSTMVDCDGHEQVVGFHAPGELIGLEAVYSGLHHCDVVSLGMSRVCVLPYKQLMELAGRIPALFERLFGLLSKEIGNTFFATGDYAAEERFAAFLLALAQRLSPGKKTSLRLALPMSRADIANYLRIADATLSRILAAFRKLGLIETEGRILTITNLDGLLRVARRVPPISA